MRSFLLMMLAVPLLFSCWSSARADEPEPDLAPLVDLLGQVDDATFQLDLLKGMRDGLKGRKSLPMPEAWPQVYDKLAKSENEEVRQQARLLALVFGDPRVLKELEQIVLDRQKALAERQAALNALVEKRVAELSKLLFTLLKDDRMRSAAIRALAAFGDPKLADVLLGIYPQSNETERQDIINTLAARPEDALKLLQAVKSDKIDRRDVSAFTARQLLSLGNEEVSAQLKAIWGDIRETSEDKRKLITKYTEMLRPEVVKKADLVHGRLVFARTCMKCHKLHDMGGTIGPELTGSNRANLDYILENVIDPSAVIGRDYQLMIVLTTEGRVINGIIVEETVNSYTIQTVNDKVVISKDDVEEARRAPISMMPEGQFEKLTPEEIRDLVGYLAAPTQTPLPEGVTLPAAE